MDQILLCVCVRVFFPFILDIKFVGRTSRGHTGGRSHRISHPTRSTIGGGQGCNKFVPVFGGNGTKIAPTGDIFDQPPGRMRRIWGKLADHVGDHVVLSPEGAVLVTSPGTKSSFPRPPQSLNPSSAFFLRCVPLFFSREEFSHSFPSSTVKSNLVY